MCESELFLWKTLIRLSTDENKAVTQSRSRVITLTKNIKWTVICVQKQHRATSLAKHHFLQLPACLTKPDGGTSVRARIASNICATSFD